MMNLYAAVYGSRHHQEQAVRLSGPPSHAMNGDCVQYKTALPWAVGLSSQNPRYNMSGLSRECTLPEELKTMLSLQLDMRSHPKTGAETGVSQFKGRGRATAYEKGRICSTRLFQGFCPFLCMCMSGSRLLLGAYT